MIGKIRFIADLQDSAYERTSFPRLLAWLRSQLSFEFDIETNMTDWWHDKQLICMQFGSCTEERVQWFVQWSALTPEEQEQLIEFLNRSKALKLIHNARFEYIVLRFYGIVLENIYDTMLAEKVLRGGMENMEYSLADISWKYLRIVMNKELQTQFGDNIITDDKILYAITDVAYLTVIRRQQLAEACLQDCFGYSLLNTIGLEMDALPAFSDITYEGMLLDVRKWRENIALAEPLVQAAYDKLNAWLNMEPFHSYAIEKGYLSHEDRITINYNSPPQRTELLQKLFPDIAGATKPIIRKYIRDKGMEIGPENIMLLQDFSDKQYEATEQRLIAEHRQWLIEHDYLIPSGQITINWNSQPQVLPLVQLVLPKLRSLAEDERNKFVHPILKDWEKYGEANKLLTTYGEQFIQSHVSSDGKVRTNFNQVVSTGRVSTSKPNMQNIPVKEFVGKRYRNAFVCDENFVFVDSDYSSQELCIIAYMSNDPVWLGCLQRGEDLHSVCSELVYGKKWKDAAEPTCAYYYSFVDKEGVYHPANSKQKCSCKKHKSLRDGVKSINFGLAFGMSEYKLAGDLNIPVPAARELITTYFRVFPAIGALLEWLGRFGVENGFIMTLAPFNRKRFFPYWRENNMYIWEHTNKVRFNGTLGEIERASKNHPVQGSAADMVKVAMIMMRQFIRENGYEQDIKLVAQVHDQITTICRKGYEQWWKEKMDAIMREAALLIIPTGILKAETTVSPYWTK